MNWKFENGRIYYENENGELMAEATYEVMMNGEINIDHTYVNPILRGQGIAHEMMVAVTEYVRREGKKCMATCSYANIWFEKNEDLCADIIATGDEPQGAACKIDGKH